MTEKLQSKPARRNRIPTWAAALIILMAVGGGSWLVYRYLIASEDKVAPDIVELDSGQYGFGGYGRRGNGNGRPPQRSLLQSWGFGAYPEGVSRQPSGAIVARQGNAYVRAYAAARGGYSVILDYVTRSAWVSTEQMRLHRLAIQLVNNSDLASRLKVSADQKKKLNDLAYEAPLTATERSELQSLARQWDSTKDPAVQAPTAVKLLAVVAKVGPAHEAETKVAMLKRVQGIAQILSPEQLKLAQNQLQGTGQNNPPSGRNKNGAPPPRGASPTPPKGISPTPAKAPAAPPVKPAP